MQSFKQFLTEGTSSGFAPWHEKDPAKIKQILYQEANNYKWKLSNSPYRINKSGSVSFKLPSIANWKITGIGPIPDGRGFTYKWSKIECYSGNITDDKITNLWGFPEKVSNDFVIKSKSLKILDHLNTVIEGNLTLDCNDLDSWGDCFIVSGSLNFLDLGTLGLREVAKHVKTDKVRLGMIVSRRADKSNRGLLGLTLLKSKSGNKVDIAGTDRKILEIVNDNIDDIMECREALVQAGFKEYAKL